MTEPLLCVENLEKYYFEHDTLLDRVLGNEPQSVKAVDGLSFEIRQGETLGLVGESGCGKSTTGETLLGLEEPTRGSVRFDGEDVFEMDDQTSFRKRAGIVFQDPFSSLDPRMTVGEIVREPLDVHGVGTPAERRERVEELIERVGLSTAQVDRYPHEFSGGQNQRVSIARGLALDPDFLVLDEPVSALDVSVQAQILNLLDDLQSEFGLTYLFIAHDLSVVRHISDRVAVMYLGEIVERGPVDDIFDAPKHPYTRGLLENVPRADPEEHDRDVSVVEGDVPSPRNPPSGCRFHTRCADVIQPPDLDVDQALYRELVDFRRRVESGELAVGDESTPESASGTADGSAAESTAVEAVIDDHFTEPVGDAVRPAVAEAVERLLAGDEDGATETLAERFESVCERDHPVLQSTDHPAACHLYEQPASTPE